MIGRSRELSKKVVIPAVIVLGFLVLTGGYFGVRKWQDSHEPKQVVQTTVPDAIDTAKQDEVAKRPGTYEVYDPAKLVLAKDGKVVLFFNASWSKTSKLLDKDLKNNTTKLPSNFTILSVDYNKNTALRKKYNVPFENTFVQVDENGVVVNEWSGSEDMAEIVALAK